jgi:hypothetical protein
MLVLASHAHFMYGMLERTLICWQVAAKTSLFRIPNSPMYLMVRIIVVSSGILRFAFSEMIKLWLVACVHRVVLVYEHLRRMSHFLGAAARVEQVHPRSVSTILSC